MMENDINPMHYKSRTFSVFKNAGGRALYFEIFFVIFALAAAGGSSLVLLGLTTVAPNRKVSLFLIFLNLCLALGLLVGIYFELSPIIKAWRARRAASRLHIRVITLFSLVATLPALALAVVGATLLNLGIDRWFEKNTREIVRSSISIANVYAREALQTLSMSAYGMALSLDNKNLLSQYPMEYRRRLTIQAAARNLRAAFLLSSTGAVYFSAALPGGNDVPIPPALLIAKAQSGKPFLFQPGLHDYFGVIIKFKNIENAFLYIVRNVDENVLKALRLTEANTERYRMLDQTRMPMQVAFGVLYISLFLVLLLSAIWTGIAVADRLVRPIRRLITAADDVASGNLALSALPVHARDGDVAQLTRTFNYMVKELKTQRDELISARDQIDERRRFSEAVLSGVTAGIIGVSSDGVVTIVNRSVQQMFNRPWSDIIGKKLSDLNPQIDMLFTKASQSKIGTYRDQLVLGKGNHTHVYNIQITMQKSTAQQHAGVVTIDDITDLVEAQRSFAWADIARRIAHEIKNPLTPIQLSAERIRRRYSDALLKDRDVLDVCTETIIRQVESIGRMVDEFSSFARMPKPTMECIDLRMPLRQACFLVEVSRPDLYFEEDLPKEALLGKFDNRLIAQAFSNVIKNASEAIDALVLEHSQDLPKGHIRICSRKEGNAIIVEVIDNGKGLPHKERQKLLEPYITTRKKGTGLGLAIVRKIVEDHGGKLELHDAPQSFYGGRGAMIRMLFPAIAD